MKKALILIVCIVPFLFAGCDQQIPNARIANNTTGEVQVLINLTSGSVATPNPIVIAAGETYQSDIPYDQVKSVVMAGTSNSIKYNVYQDWIMFYVTSAPVSTWAVKSMLPDKQFVGSGALQLKEINGRMDPTPVAITNGLAQNVTVYTASPVFQLIDPATSEATSSLNGISVALRYDWLKLIIYIE